MRILFLNTLNFIGSILIGFILYAGSMLMLFVLTQIINDQLISFGYKVFKFYFTFILFLSMLVIPLLGSFLLLQVVRKNIIKTKTFTVGVSLGILTAFFLFAYLVFSVQPRNAQRDSTRIFDMRNIQSALNFYHEKNNEYPLGDYNTIIKFLVSEGILYQTPEDPLNNKRNYYEYRVSPNNNNYILRVLLEYPLHPSLDSDIDISAYGLDCADPFYCIDRQI